MAASTTKKRVNQTTYTHVPGSAGQYDPFANSGPFQGSTSTPPATVTRATSSYTGSQNHITALAANSTLTDVPQSYLDEVAAGWELSERNTGRAQTPTQQVFDQTAKQAWDSLTPDEKQRYVQQDQQKVAGQNQANLQSYASQELLSGTARDQQVANQMWQPVTQAQQRAVSAQNAQVTGDRAAEADLNGRVGEYTNTIRGNQDLRMADINATNAANSTLAGNYMTETLAANQRNTGFANQLTDAANSTNANQTGLFNTFSGQMSGINANQSAALSGFMGDISSANAQQNANLSQFGGAVRSANSAQNQIVAQYSAQLANMNSQDQAAYMKYLSETDPLMAQLVAQGSNPEYVHNMEDVVNRYRDLSTPQVTDQERFLAELARRKFESDDKSSRDAVMQQLATRGLKSGGLVIANQQAAQQQNSQDRMLNELGLNAQAVSRGMQGLAGYSSASAALRNADDAMRNFQDQYAQNEYVRRGNLAQQRNQQSLATTGQITARDTAGYNARTQSNQLNYGRNLDYYNAGTQTVNDNFSRTQAGYDATSQTNRDNAGRDQAVFNAGTDTNNQNFGRTQTAIGTQIGVNQGNLGNFLGATNLGIGTNTDNSTRYQGGLDKGDLGAGSILGAQTGAIGFKTGNLASEAQTQTGYVPIAAGTAETGTRIQQGLTREQQDALDRLFRYGNLDQAKAAAGLS